VRVRSVGGREYLRLHELHVPAVDLEFAVAGLDDEELDAGRFVFVTLTELDGHSLLPLLLEFERRVTAGEFAVAALGDDEL
jgi:hypothetical protein